MNLCSICKNLDIRKLLLRADEDGFSKYSTLEEKLEKAQTALHVDEFFSHQPSLDAVRIASPLCELCAAIWLDYIHYRTRPYTNPGASSTQWATTLTAPTGGDLGEGQIYLTAAPRNTAKHGKSQIVAFRSGRNHSVNILGWFDVYTEYPEQIDRSDLLLRPIHAHAGTEECFALARDWLETCLRQHGTCKTQRRALSLPARVLEILPMKEGDCFPKVRLIDCDNSARPFAALSYSWGGESAQMLTAETEVEFRHVIPDAALPPTMRDAITVTRELGIKYLWIDALNIFQDSEDDFVKETSKMRDIYRGALITTAGSSAAKISDRLLDRREDPRWRCSLPWKQPHDDDILVYLRPSEEYSETTLKRSPINSRGWCLQESLLAPRTLWLGSPVNVFECACGQFDEAGRVLEATERYRSKALISAIDLQRNRNQSSKLLRHIGVPSVVHLGYLSLVRNEWTGSTELQGKRRTILTQGELTADGERFTIYDHWRAIVQHYTERHLTRREDIMPALSGLAAHFASALDDEFLAGVWRSDLIRSLCWKPVTAPGQELSRENFPTDSYVAPSWSWASASNVKIRFEPGVHNQPDASLIVSQKAKVVECGNKTATADPYGKANSAYIVLRGYFLPLTYPYKLGSLPFGGDGSTTLNIDNETLTYEYKRNEFRARHVDQLDQKFGLLHLCTMTDSFGRSPLKNASLLLIESTGDGRSYKRVGFHTVRLGGSLGVDDETRARDFKAAAWTRRRVYLI